MTHLLRDTLYGSQRLMKDPGSGHLLKGVEANYAIRFHDIAYPWDFLCSPVNKVYRLMVSHVRHMQYYYPKERPGWRFGFYLSAFPHINAADFPGDQGDEIYEGYWWVRFMGYPRASGLSAYYGFWARSWGQHTGSRDLKYWPGEYGEQVSLGHKDDPYDPWVNQLYWAGGQATIFKYRDD